jgi:glycosyltransferase involved in cell wall biosynthesis
MRNTERCSQSLGMRERSNPMRVLIVTRNLRLASGVANVVLDYLGSFPRDRVAVEHASFVPPEPSFKQELESHGISTFQLDDHRPLASLSILHRLLKDRQFDLTVGTSWKAYALAALAGIGTRTKSVAWIHGIPLAVEGLVRKYSYRILFRHQAIIFASKAVQSAHSYRSHVGKEYVVYAGIAPLPPLYPRRMRAIIGVPNDAFVVGYTAEFVEWKNHRVLLKVGSTLADKYPSLHIVLIGDGPTRKEITRMSTALGLDGRVHFLGKRRDAKELLGTFDAYIHPSDGEAFGLALAEAMLAGLPVLASNTGAFPEIIENEITGLLVPPHDVPKICEGVARLINDPVLRLELGRRAQQAIARRFTVEKFTTALTEAFESAISQ